MIETPRTDAFQKKIDRRFGDVEDARDAFDFARQLEVEAEVNRIECAKARAQFEHVIAYLTHIHALLNPPDVAANGKTYRFHNPHANETLQALSEAIREIPAKLAALAGSADSKHCTQWSEKP